MNVSHSRICEAGVVQQHDPLLHRFMLLWSPPRSSIQLNGEERKSVVWANSVCCFMGFELTVVHGERRPSKVVHVVG